MGTRDTYKDDNQLIEELRAGDREAYRILVDKYHVKVIRTCKGFVHSTADAEDIAQEVFIEVFRSISRFRGESELSTWIYRIAVTRSLNFLRSASRRKVISFFTGQSDMEEPWVPEKQAGPESSPDQIMFRTEQARALEKALSSLPENQRTAFVLNKYDDLSYKEISDIMNVSIGSVESLIFRAKQNLQKKLTDFYKKNIL